jgi:hypothetical protein
MEPVNKNLVIVVFLVCCSFVAIAALGISNSQSKQKTMAEMVSKGADPQAVACAVDGVNAMNQQVCTSLAMQVKQLINLK